MEKSMSSVVVPASSKRGRDAETVECGEHKKPKIESGPLELVGINDFCLEAIFQHLTMIDLINVAESCNRFIPAAVSVYHRIHRSKPVVLCNGRECHRTQIPIADSIAEAFFRHFDHSVSKLEIDVASIDVDADIEQFIQPDRLTSLVELELFGCSEIDFEEFNEPFPLVEKLTIGESTLGENLAQLNRCFPNVTTLKLSGISTMWLESLEVHQPKLKQLTIYQCEGDGIPKSTIIEMLQSNPQLESLSLHHSEVDELFLRSIVKHLQQVKSLEVCLLDDRFFNFDDEPILLESVENFTLMCDLIVRLPFEFKNLREFKLQGCFLQLMDFEFKIQLRDFFGRNRKLVKLTLDFCDDAWEEIELDDIAMLIEPLSKLDALQFRADVFEADEIIRFMTKHTQLKTIRLAFKEPKKHESMCSAIKKLETKWTIAESKRHRFVDIERLLAVHIQ